MQRIRAAEEEKAKANGKSKGKKGKGKARKGAGKAGKGKSKKGKGKCRGKKRAEPEPAESEEGEDDEGEEGEGADLVGCPKMRMLCGMGCSQQPASQASAMDSTSRPRSQRRRRVGMKPKQQRLV